MNRIKSITNPLMWFMALLLAAFVAGCGGGNGTQASQASSAKAITAFSLAAVSGVPASTGTVITEGTTPKTIAVTMPSGTVVTHLVATFTTTGSSVKVGTKAQVTGTTQNNFTMPMVYTVTAADGTTANYTVTVTKAVAAGPVAVDLKSILTNNFVILATTAITEATPASGLITGNIGNAGGGAAIAVTCAEMVGTSKIHASDAAYGGGTAACAVNTSPVLGQAISDLGAAYTAASAPATPAAVDAAHLDLLAGTISAGTTFAPGVYTWGSAVSITGNIILTGSSTDVWIFQMSGNLTTAAGGAPSGGAQVTVSGGALASNVFWQVGGASVTLGTYSTFSGNILTSPSTLIAIGTGAVLHGRALSGSSVALDGNIVGP